ncbi:nucleotide exchange factor GrpE [Urechidicola sp. KH5]
MAILLQTIIEDYFNQKQIMSTSKENIEDKEVQNEAQTNEQQEVNQEETVVEEVNAEEQIKAEKDKFLRLFAEFENYKKRTSKERIELFKTANQELMTVLLPILDDFDRGLAEIKKAKDKELLKGMELINSKLKNTLTQKGLADVEAKAGDAFDAEIHEAITQIPAPSEDLKGKIVDVVEKGYKLGDKIIRYPKVVIGQ